MAKKYLLYIHDERFSAEAKKSELVNNLLERHYHGTVGGKTQEEINTEIDEKIYSRKGPQDIASAAVKAIKFCKHDHVVGLCKQGCK